MDTTRARLRSTQLNDRTLWFDGDSSFDPANLLRTAAQFNDILYVDAITPDVLQFNQHASKDRALKVKERCNPLSFDWKLPLEYQTLDVVEYLCEKHIALTRRMDEKEATARDYRLISEIAKYKKHDLIDVLRAIIWIINTLTEHNVVWGVGRGSSVSSYVLYVIGVHDVDSFAYGLDIDDFLHE